MPDSVKGYVDLLLLAALARGRAHGYALLRRVRERSDGVFDFAEGTVYPALYRLERQGLVRSDWEPGATRRRRVYRLTRKGTHELSRERDEWRRLARAVEAAIA